jgi:putative ABC transport system substrate-binding protein
MSYSPDRADLWHRCAVYVDKILKGASPADLPVQQPTKFECPAAAQAAPFQKVALAVSWLTARP